VTIPAKSRVAVLVAPAQFEFRTIPIPELGPGDVLLRVDACGVCGSDVSMYRGRGRFATYPVIPGHEIIGTVVAVGPDASTVHPAMNERIVVEEVIPCHSCALCTSGRHRLCRSARRFGTTPLLTGAELLGGFSQYLHISSAAIWHPVPDKLPAADATLFIPLSNGLSWLRDAGEFRAGDVVLVMGPGQHGLACAYAARRMGAALVIVSGTSRDATRLKAARDLGADVIIDSDNEDLVTTILNLTHGEGANLIIDATPAASILPDAQRCAAIGGRIVAAGAKAGATAEISLDWALVRELRIHGVNARQSWAIPAALDLIARAGPDLDPLRGHDYPLRSVAEAIEALEVGNKAAAIHTTILPNAS
jgi:threonine dehydrogenase-like Zn-dependent dehydrogenase